MSASICLCLALCLLHPGVARAAEPENPFGPLKLAALDFESLELFTQDFSATGWDSIDGDGHPTYVIQTLQDNKVLREYTFPGSRGAMAFIPFAPEGTTPAITALSSPNYDRLLPHSGTRCAASFASTGGANDDTLLSPAFQALPRTELRFFARAFLPGSGDTIYEEKYVVGVALADGQEVLLREGVASPEGWEEILCDLSAYAGQTIRIFIRYVGENGFLFLVDDIEVNGWYDVSLDLNLPESLECYAGESPATIVPALLGAPEDYAPRYTFSSGNPDVAQITDDGVIHARANGKTTIRVSLADGLLEKSVLLNVLLPADAVRIASPADCLQSGRSLALVGHVEPSMANDMIVAWSSSDDARATVDEHGIVHGHKAGNVTIYAVTETGAMGSYDLRIQPAPATLFLLGLVGLLVILIVLCVIFVLRRKKEKPAPKRRHSSRGKRG